MPDRLSPMDSSFLYMASTWRSPPPRCTYPVVPLAKGQTVSIGITSYDGGVFYGLNADRDAMDDVDLLATSIGASLDELRETP